MENLTFEPLLLISADINIHPILWGVKNDHKRHLPYAEVEVFLTWPYSSFSKSWWSDCFTPALVQDNHGIPYLETRLLPPIIKWSLRRMQKMYSYTYKRYIEPTTSLFKIYTNTLTKVKRNFNPILPALNYQGYTKNIYILVFLSYL